MLGVMSCVGLSGSIDYWDVTGQVNSYSDD
jgi:hypothetical protein